MKTNIGIWLDHRKAVIVTVSGAEEEIHVILSDAERQPGRIDGQRSTAPFESHLVMADDVKERKFTHELHLFYQEVTDCLTHAEAILIMGPGEAKGQLRKHLKEILPKAWVTAVETADKMTNRQIAAHIRDHFKKEHPIIAL